MTTQRNFYLSDSRKPKNPVKDILIFEKRVKRSFNYEFKRRIMYLIVAVSVSMSYVLYIAKMFINSFWRIKIAPANNVKVLILDIYVQMLVIIFIICYLFIRLLRRSRGISEALSSQLKLLNISFTGQRLSLCQIRAPENIRKALQLFREEEQRRKASWLRKEVQFLS